MLYGVFSDVHSNYEALEVVLDYLKSRQAQAYICCGDLVGYGPQPNECVEAVSALANLRCVSGNHDLAVTGAMSLKWFNSYARAVIETTRAEISSRCLEFLKSLPPLIEESSFTVVHGSPCKPAEEYLLTGEQYLENSEGWSVSPCFIGHSHVPVWFSQKGVRFPRVEFMEPGFRFFLEAGSRYMINPCSVGQPRDRNPKASCGLYDSEKDCFELVRLEYPVARTQELMRLRKTPQILIERLSFGW